MALLHYPAILTATTVLTDASSIATNAINGPVFTVTLAGNRTLANPTNLRSGQSITWVITQDGTGNRTLAYGAAFKFAGGIKTLSTAAAAIDVLIGVYDGTTLFCVLNKAYTT